MKIYRTSLSIIASVLLMGALSCQNEKYSDLGDGLFAEIVTSKGTMVVKLTHEKTPVTVANFVALAEGTHPMMAEQYKGKKFYNGLIFHRVMDQFMIQGGCPNGNGMGNPGYRFADEFDETLKHDKPGVLSMANGGPGTNGSQFFITEVPKPHLDNVHSVFGQVVLGLEIQDTISNVPVAARNKPIEDVVIQEINIVRQGFDARKFDAVKVWETELPLLEEKNRIKAEEARKKAEEERRLFQERLAEKKEEKKKTLEEYKSKGSTIGSGVTAYTIKAGDGPKPAQGSRVSVHYEGYFPDGRLFASSRMELEKEFGIYDLRKERQGGWYGEQVMTISPDARLITGFKEGMATMKVGDVSYFYLPSHLAYGASGSPPAIPPNADIIYIIEMIEIVN